MATKGFYMMGHFPKGKKARFYVDYKQPFTINRQDGTVTAKVVRLFKENIVFDEWEFLEDYTITHLNTDNKLIKRCNDIWSSWCKKYKRKQTPLLKLIGK